MSHTLRIPVDVTNPGQFFACCGLLELAHRQWPAAEGWFESGRFSLARLDQEAADLSDLLRPLLACTIERLPGADAKTAPIRLGTPLCVSLRWWLRSDGSANLFKTWAANATSLQMFCKWRQPLANLFDSIKNSPEGLFAFTSRIQGSYGFDSDLCWDALTVGFSFNEHSGLKALPTRPPVEMLGALGLQRFFPNLDERAQIVQYATWGVPLTAPVASAASLGLLPSATLHRLKTRFVYRGTFKGLDGATIIQGDADE